MISGFVLPDTDDADTAPFWAATRERKLVVQRCEGCGQLRFPPQPYCGKCRQAGTTWVPISGRGSIWSYVIAHSPTLAAYEPFVPFPIAVIEIEEDKRLRMVGNLVADESSPINSVNVAAIAIGRPVRVVFQQVAPDVFLPRWQLEADRGHA
jgi:uncharacterized protein